MVAKDAESTFTAMREVSAAEGRTSDAVRAGLTPGGEDQRLRRAVHGSTAKGDRRLTDERDSSCSGRKDVGSRKDGAAERFWGGDYFVSSRKLIEPMIESGIRCSQPMSEEAGRASTLGFRHCTIASTRFPRRATCPGSLVGCGIQYWLQALWLLRLPGRFAFAYRTPSDPGCPGIYATGRARLDGGPTCP